MFVPILEALEHLWLSLIEFEAELKNFFVKWEVLRQTERSHILVTLQRWYDS